MVKKSKRKASRKVPIGASERTRIDAHHALQRAVKREEQIKRLVKRLERGTVSADRKLRELAQFITSRAGDDLLNGTHAR